MTSLNWKFTYHNPLQSFTNPTLGNQTTLSRNYCDLIERRLRPIMNWKIIKQSSSTNSLQGKRILCLEEKICILKYLNRNLLNSKKEMILACRHRNKFFVD